MLTLNKQSDIYSSVNRFADLFEISAKDAQWIYNNYVNNDKLRKEICDNDEINYISPFESLFPLASMLIQDGLDTSYYNVLGFKKYKDYGGKCNPYESSSIYAEEDNDGVTFLEHIQKWIKRHLDEFEKIYNYLDNIQWEGHKPNILYADYILNGDWKDDL